MSEQADRLSKLNTGQYDQVFAITQSMINDALYYLHKRSLVRYEILETQHTQDPEKYPKPVVSALIRRDSFGTHGSKFKNVTFDPPKIILPVDPNLGRTSVWFVVNFKSGEWAWELEDEDDNVTESGTVNIAGWSYAVMVNFAMSKVGDIQDVPEPERPAMENLRARLDKVLPGTYSIERLLLDLSTPSLITNWSASNIPAEIKNDPRNIISLKFGKGFQSYLKLLNKESDVRLLHIAKAEMKPKEGLETPLDFVPTSYTVQVIPHINHLSDGQAKSGLSEGKFNCFCYLQMTGGRPMPTGPGNTPYQFTPEFNWSNGEIDQHTQGPQQGGIFCSSRSRFIQNYLIGKLRYINKRSELFVNDVRVSEQLAVFENNKVEYGASVNSGNNPDHPKDDDPYFDFQYDSPGRYVWNKKQIKGPARDIAGAVPGWKSWVEGNAEVSTNNVLKWAPGADFFDIEGSTTAKFSMRRGDGHDFTSPSTFTDWFKYTSTWNMKGKLRIAQDGGIEIDLEGPTIHESTSNYLEEYLEAARVAWEQWKRDHGLQDSPWAMLIAFLTGFKYLDTRAMLPQPGNTKILGEYKSKFQDVWATFQQGFKGLQNELSQAFYGENHFFIPGQDAYFFKDPILSANGDLVCGVEYKLIDSEEDLLNWLNRKLPNGENPNIKNMPCFTDMVANAEILSWKNMVIKLAKSVDPSAH